MTQDEQVAVNTEAWRTDEHAAWVRGLADAEQIGVRDRGEFMFLAGRAMALRFGTETDTAAALAYVRGVTMRAPSEAAGAYVPRVGCTNVDHDAVDCRMAGIDVAEFCEACR